MGAPPMLTWRYGWSGLACCGRGQNCLFETKCFDKPSIMLSGQYRYVVFKLRKRNNKMPPLRFALGAALLCVGSSDRPLAVEQQPLDEQTPAKKQHLE